MTPDWLANRVLERSLTVMSKFKRFNWLLLLPVLAAAFGPSQSSYADGVVSGGVSHTCALTASGGALCWGDNSHGQLGDGSTANSSIPMDVSGLSSGVSAVTAGNYHSCALTASGGVMCWGDNSYGQLGDGTAANSNVPVGVSGLSSGISAITAGGYYTCALTASGGIKCWGRNNTGQLGDGTKTDSSTPVNVSGLSSGVTAIAAGGYGNGQYGHTCALTASGGVKCWGPNTFGQVGDGSGNNNRPAPVDVSGLSSGVSAIAAGGTHTCALTAAGGVKCWGFNRYGQLGDGTTVWTSATPVDVSGLNGVVSAITANADHTCALNASGGIKCWGFNNGGQLGDGTKINSNLPVDVSGLSSGVSAVGAGYHHACALISSGGRKCWGHNNYGQLGDGTVTSSLIPVWVYSTGSLQFSSSTYSGLENGGSGLATVTVIRSGGSSGAASIDYATSDNTATAGSDYTAVSGSLNWSHGDDSDKTFTVAILDDNDAEGDEDLVLSLGNAMGARLGAPAAAMLTIQDTSCPEHAVYDSDSRILHMPFLEVLVLDPITQQPTGEILVVSMDLELLLGRGDFTIAPGSLTVLNTAWQSSSCHARHSYAERSIYIPWVDVEQVILLPGGSTTSLWRTYEVTLKELPLDVNVYQLESYTLR
ncbi:MAG: hypothetical protein GY862_21530 [Gammaproteobacteria bacterium]|nr:hypothetical protein [Gammaproteobacteria bacterium]